MKIVFSNLSMSIFNNINHKQRKENIAMAKLSNFLIQNHGFQTCFYGDRVSLESFKDIGFDELHEIKDDRIKEIPEKIWSIGKLFTMLQINEPFIHVDYDILLFKKFDQDFLNNEVVFFHNEFHMDSMVQNYQDYFQLQPPNTRFLKPRSYNCALIGGQNFKLIHTICNEIIDFVIEKKVEINNFLDLKISKQFPSFFPAILVEQSWIFQLLKYYKQEFTPYLKSTQDLSIISQEGYVKNICHLQGNKSKELILNNIQSMNNFLNI